MQSALKVDVTSLVSKAEEAESSRRRAIVVVVVSNVTRSRDVVKMVVHKLGMDQRDVLSMQLVAEVNYRSHDRGKLSEICLWENSIFLPPPPSTFSTPDAAGHVT